MDTFPSPKLPVFAHGINRDGNSATAAWRNGGGVEPAAVDCSKLHGPARAICYQAQATVAPPLIPADPLSIGF
ncbi:hypothetical protein [Streptomyces sp. NPDC005799]|uniref:hypothetical protein n=1 Tax=Streptomyces sp. NPDC005799 TaxID=3154678 RepID=UPI00340A04D3